jgi:hypothetical protein
MSGSAQVEDDVPDGPQEAVTSGSDVTAHLRRMLFRLASEQDTLAATEAALVPYWKACPPSVTAIRLAARALRAAAESLPTVPLTSP